MSWYYGTFSCGHEGRVNICGPVKNRQWIADRKFEKMCEECYEQYLEEERKRLNTEAFEKAKEMELPELVGTEKQVVWANTLRQRIIDNAELMDKKYFETHRGLDLTAEEVPQILNYILINKTKAEYYIDSRYSETRRILYNERHEALKTDEQKAKEKAIKLENAKIEKLVKEEATVFPDNKCTNAIAEIRIEDSKIKAFFERDDDFRKVVKDLDFTWCNGYWGRTIYERNGTVEDRAAELGHKLLKEGFPIMVLDENIRKKAINADYKTEIYRWIDIRRTGDYKGRLKITWYGMNDRLYKVARKLPGSIYDSRAVLIKIEHCEEVEEFADLYDFKFTEKAIKTIEAYKEELNNIKTVKVAKGEEVEFKDGLEEILHSSTDVIDDLMDDD